MFTKRTGSFILAAAVIFCFLAIFVPSDTNIAKAAAVSSISVKSNPTKAGYLVGQDIIEVRIKGDISGDGNVTAVDALMALQAASDRRTLNDIEKAAADVNGDGNVTTTDALMILQFVSGRIPSLNSSAPTSSSSPALSSSAPPSSAPPSSAPPSSSALPSSSAPPSSAPPSSSSLPNSSTTGVAETMFETEKPIGHFQQYEPWDAGNELGNIFQSSVNGKVTKVRYYSGAGETGAHNVSIWNYDTAICLAGPFSWTPETGEGWKEYTLATPVSITASVNYMVVVSTGEEVQKRYVIIQNGIGGSNGSNLSWQWEPCRVGALGTMPNTKHKDHWEANYVRDVVFEPYAPPPSAGGSGQVSGYGLNFTGLSQAFAASPVDNPLKGFMPFKGSFTQLPHSMEWWYIPFSDLMNGVDSYTFNTGLENVLNEIAGRGHQAAFRIYLDYPGRQDNATPQFIWDAGVAKHAYNNDAGIGVMPDWKDQRLIDILDKFIREFGNRYDGDPRIGTITTGLIGHWGEYHTWPEIDLMPSNIQLNQLFKAWDDSFNTTKLATRYPDTASAVNYKIGYHDDSFTESTIGTMPWYFMQLLRNVNGVNKWRTEIIGGEFYPPFQIPFINGASSTSYQNYDACVNESHCSWLMYHQAFFKTLTNDQLTRLSAASKKLGYDLSVSEATAKIQAANNIQTYVKIDNKGVAPFYYKWAVKLALVNSSNAIVKQYDTDWDITTILPNTPVEYGATLDVSSVSAGSYKLVMKVNNPMSNGHPFKFANTSQDANVSGWVTLATISK